MDYHLADVIEYPIHIFSVQKFNKDSFTFIEQFVWDEIMDIDF
jgi:hypothetical protein